MGKGFSLSLSLLAFILFAIVFSEHSSAEESTSRYPEPQDNYVNDFAEILNERDIANIREICKRVESKAGVEISVVTIDSISDYETGDETIEAFATNLFNKWGIGNKKRNDGVLLLIAKSDRKVRIEIGKGYGSRYDSIMSDIVNQHILPYFRQNEYSRGTFEGTRAIIEAVTKKVSWFSYYKWHILIVILILLCIFAGISCLKSGKSGWGWAFFAIAGIFLFILIRMMMSRGSSGGFGGGSSFGGGATGSW